MKMKSVRLTLLLCLLFGATYSASAQFFIGLNQHTDFVKKEVRELTFINDAWGYMEDDEIEINFSRASVAFGYMTDRFTHRIEFSYTKSFIPLRRKVRVSALDLNTEFFSIGYFFGKTIQLSSDRLSFHPSVGIIGYQAESAYTHDGMLAIQVPYTEEYKGLKVSLSFAFNYELTDKLALSIAPVITGLDIRNYKYTVKNPAIPISQQLREDDTSGRFFPFDRSIVVGIMYSL